MPLIESAFKPAWFARGGHAQTLWAPLFRKHIPVKLKPERIELPDGDFVDTVWCEEVHAGPIVIILHGLEGTSESPYVRGMMRALAAAGLRSVLLHFRGCGGEANRLPRAYHSGDTEDLAYFVECLRERFSGVPLAAVGYSLGGNVLLKWLGETGDACPLQVAAAVSPPFDLARCADYIFRGSSRIYNNYLLASLKRKVIEKAATLEIEPPIPLNHLKRLKSIRDFDDRITAPLHGFDSAHDYYTRCSCGQFLDRIARPTLVIHAVNDPFMPDDIAPDPAGLPPSVHLELPPDGGHVGFVSGRNPRTPEYYLEHRVPAFMAERLY